MKILNLDQIFSGCAEIKVDPATKELRMTGVPEKIGNIDKNVVEAAVRLKEATGAEQCRALPWTAAAKDSFKDVLAMGLDEVFLVEDPFAGERRRPDGSCVFWKLPFVSWAIRPDLVWLCQR